MQALATKQAVDLQQAQREAIGLLPAGEPAMSESQRGKLADVVAALESHGVTADLIAQGVSNLTAERVRDWEQLTAAEAAKVAASFTNRLNGLTKEAK